MGRDDSAHRELAALLAPAPAARICEIGFGRGQLLALLTANHVVAVNTAERATEMVAAVGRLMQRG